VGRFSWWLWLWMWVWLRLSVTEPVNWLALTNTLAKIFTVTGPVTIVINCWHWVSLSVSYVCVVRVQAVHALTQSFIIAFAVAQSVSRSVSHTWLVLVVSQGVTKITLTFNQSLSFTPQSVPYTWLCRHVTLNSTTFVCDSDTIAVKLNDIEVESLTQSVTVT